MVNHVVKHVVIPFSIPFPGLIQAFLQGGKVSTQLGHGRCLRGLHKAIQLLPHRQLPLQQGRTLGLFPFVQAGAKLHDEAHVTSQ